MPTTFAVTAHRNDHGPFTAAGNLLRAARPHLLPDHLDLLQTHDIEVLAVAPEFGDELANLRENQTAAIAPQVRTRYYPPAWMTRISHGLVDLLLGLAERGVVTEIVVTETEHADPTDREFLDILARRGHPRISLRRIPGADPATLPPGPTDLAEYYVRSDCTSEDPRLVGAYRALSDRDRARLHDARAAQLRERIAAGEISLRRWTLALHARLGSDPDGAGVTAMTEAIEECVLAGFYDAVVELGGRLLPHLAAADRPDERWLVTAKLTLALSALGRLEEAEAAYDEACAATTHASTHLQSYYGRAMLLTRFAAPSKRDHARAKALVNTAITIASLLPDSARRAFNTTFNENGLALVEMHLGNLHESLRLVETGIARLDAADEHDRDAQHRWLLEHNRAQLLAALARPAEALECYDRLLAVDPNHSEYHLDMAGVLRGLGRTEDAEAHLNEAIRLSPPYPEAVYNRGDLRAAVGDLDGAVEDFARVLDLDPQFPSARVNLAGLLLEAGDPETARAVAAVGLGRDGSEADLLTVLAQADHELGNVTEAAAGYARALAVEPDHVPALAGRAALEFELDTPDSLSAAVLCLEQALRIDPNPDLADNLAVAVARQKQLAGRQG